MSNGEHTNPRPEVVEPVVVGPDEAVSASAPAESPKVESLLSDWAAMPDLTQGKIAQATVVRITEDEVFVDVGLKSEVAIPLGEFLASDGQLAAKPGDLVPVWIDHFDVGEGTVAISYQKAARIKVWDDIEAAFRDQTNVRGRVTERTKGGLIVDVGVPAFLPASQADLRPLRNVDLLKGQEITCKVIKINRKRNNVVVSRRLALEEEANRRKAQVVEQLVEGAELEGQVKNLTDYGAFVDLGGMDGLLHVTDMSWTRVGHPSEVVQVGQRVRVKVLKFDREKERISLGMKQLLPDPWQRVAEKYRPGDKVTGRVVSLTDYGAFVELEPGVEGLIHISEMSWSKRIKHPSKLLKVGDRAEVAVIDLNLPERRISLSLRQTLPDPWSDLAERYPVGSTARGQVRNLTDFGAFVEIEEGVEGLIHVSDLSWTQQVKHPSELLKKGQEVEAVVLGVDLQKRRLALGIKQREQDPWQKLFARTHLGDELSGEITRVTAFGAFVLLAEGVEGLCHISEVDDAHKSNGATPLAVGHKLRFRVVRVNPTEKKIRLSLKGVTQEAESTQPATAEPAPVSVPPASGDGEQAKETDAPPLGTAAESNVEPVPSEAIQEAQPVEPQIMNQS